MRTKQDLKLEWLQEGLLHLESDDGTIVGHIPAVIGSVNDALNVSEAFIVHLLLASSVATHFVRSAPCLCPGVHRWLHSGAAENSKEDEHDVAVVVELTIREWTELLTY
eukprot:SAG22_NODE_121_length_19129_cov_36.644614_6_plen_109_part_00